MTLIKILFFIPILLLNSCSYSSDNQQVKSKNNANEKAYNFTTFSFDTMPLNAENKSKKEIHKWSDLNTFFPVYSFTNNCMGIGFEISDDYELIDNILLQNKSEKDSIAPIKTAFILKKSFKLKDAIFKNDTTKFMYIYCTKGVTISQIKDVLYNYEECFSVLILEIMPINKAKFGEPLIASKQFFDLKYENLPAFQADLAVFDQFLKDKADYKDAIPPKQFAYNDDYFFSYNDNFNWQNKDDNSCLFPTRNIYKKQGNLIKNIWSNSLDLFGIPCD